MVNHFQVLSLKKKKQKAPAHIEDPGLCLAYADSTSKQKLKNGKILCSVLWNRSCDMKFEKIKDEGFLIKRIQKRWYLRGIPLRKTVVNVNKVNVFNDIFPHLRWIASNAEKMFALPDVPPPAKPYSEPKSQK